MSETQLTLMTVQAHPDDEVTSGGGTMVRYRAEGVQTVLVTCTDGAEGEIHDPDLDENEARPRLPQIRADELARAVKIMNFSAAVNLGYRDSGMAGTPANENPASFHQADLHEAAGRLIKLIRQYRPQVLFSYNSFGGYGHPDHIKAYKITSAAFDYAADTRRYPEAEFGPAWQPSKLYTVAWSRSSWNAIWEAVRAAGEPWPFDEDSAKEGEAQAERELPEWGSPDSEITTIIDVADYYKTAYEALKEHRTQIDPNSPFTQIMQKYGHLANRNEYFILFKSHIPAQRPEYDLFAGLR